MASHATLSTLVEEMRGSRHRGARVLRFVYRNRKKHRAIIKALKERDRFRSEVCDRRFMEMQGVPAVEAKRRTQAGRHRG